MTEPQQPTAEEAYSFGGGESSYPVNPWLERTIGREAFYLGAKRGDKSEDLKKDGEARCFIIRRALYGNIYGGVQAWLQVGVREDFSVIAVPFYSAVRLGKEWVYKSKTTGKDVLAIWNGPTSKCALARLTKARMDLIAPKKFKGKVEMWPARDGKEPEVKRDYKKIFALEVLEVLFEYADVPNPALPGQTKRVVVIDPATKKPKFTINPRPFIWELNETWWEQLRAKVLAPKFAKAAESQIADIDEVQQAKPARVLPVTEPDGSTNASKVLLKLYAKTDEKYPDRAAYVVDFSPTLVIDSAAVVAVDPLPNNAQGLIDWEQIYVPLTQEQADEIIRKADGVEVGTAPATPSPAATTPSQAPAPAPASDDDIPF